MERNQAEVEKILQSCLDLIQSGQETIDSVVARYPQYEDVLRPELEIATWFAAHRDDLNPRPGFISASRQRLEAQIRQEMVSSNSHSSEPVGFSLVSLWRAWMERVKAPASFALVLVVALVVASAGMLLAARTSLPGENLYAVKIAMEKASLAVSLDQTSDAQLSVAYTERRLDEINRLVIEGQYEDVNESVTILENQVNETISTLDETADVDSGQAKELAASLKDILVNQNEVLGRLADSASGSTRQALVRAMRVSQGGIAAAQSLIQEASNPPGSSPTPQFGGTTHATATPFRPATRTPAVVVAPATPTSAPTRNPFPTDPPEPTESLRNTPTRQPDPTSTVAVPTSPPPTSLPPTLPPRPTDTPIPTPVPTNTPVPTDIPTSTPVPPPTQTPVPTNTPAPTSTSRPPTDTPEPPTATPQPPTDPPPPTNTPEPDGTPQVNPTASNSVLETATDTPAP